MTDYVLTVHDDPNDHQDQSDGGDLATGEKSVLSKNFGDVQIGFGEDDDGDDQSEQQDAADKVDDKDNHPYHKVRMFLFPESNKNAQK
jgi:hypothetical protein